MHSRPSLPPTPLRPPFAHRHQFRRPPYMGRNQLLLFPFCMLPHAMEGRARTETSAGKGEGVVDGNESAAE